MHDAVCADCGKQTQVPFQPDGPGQCIAAIATRSTGHPEEASKEIYPKIFF